MNILAVNTWFVTLIKQFFFSLDQVVFNFISEIYDLLIAIARTSILTQGDISAMAEKIYALLTVFMVFKVTLSLITYVVNPDDFADKSKGLSKLGTNIIISLSLLILTPYIFNYAFELQTIILEDNSLAKLIFETEGSKGNSSIINTAGDEIAFTAMSAFFTPNVSITEFQSCVDLTDKDGNFNPDCSGIKKDGGSYELDKTHNDKKTMAAKTGNGKFKEDHLINYVVGYEKKNLGLMFRQDLAVATITVNGSQEYVMEYKFVFSTVVGVVIILLLLTYCMDVAVRSIKLSFLQLIAPIPILSYVDPKSGKDGLFKKWYDMCFKTYLSLFIRLLALYFAIYIIGRVDSMVDIVDGSSVTDTKIKIFVIIGALMFAKQLPKMLEGLGIKLDGNGKFTLNPLKKFEEGALGGKNITGMARGALVGTAGMLTGAGVGAGLSGAWRGLTSGKGWKETGKATAEMNRKMRQAKLDGSSFHGRLGARFAGTLGIPSASERIEGRIHDIEEKKKDIDNELKPIQTRINDRKAIADKIGSMEDRAVKKIEDGEAGVISVQYKAMVSHAEKLQKRFESGDRSVSEQDVARAQNMARDYLTNAGRNDYIDVTTGRTDKVRIYDSKGNLVETKKMADLSDSEKISDATMQTFNRDLMAMAKNPETYVTKYIDEHGVEQERRVEISTTTLSQGTDKLHGIMGNLRGSMADDTRNYISPKETEKTKLDEEKATLYEQQRKAKADETAIK